MIIDNLYTSLVDYSSISPKFCAAFGWLKSNDLSSIKPDQTIVVDGDRISAQIQAYETMNPDDTRFEAHRVYIDIQLIVSGRETIYWAPLARLGKIETAYDYDKDIVFFEDPKVSVPLYLEAGDYAIFFPTDAHKTRCIVTEPERIGKIVLKIAV